MGISVNLANNIMQAFSWMLIHSLWQGLLICIVSAIILILAKKMSSAIRYNLILAAFFVFLITISSTFLYELGLKQSNISQTQQNLWLAGSKLSVHNNSPFTAGTGYLSITRSFIQKLNTYLSEHYLLIVILWFIFFIAKTVSIAGDILYIQRARHYRLYNVSDVWKGNLNSLCNKLQLKKVVKLFESGYVKTPIVIGHLKPIILMPIGLIAGISEAQVEAILLHELAHIRRNDYIVNFFQYMAEAIFFFNPGLLWLSALLRQERENCCDDVVVEQTNNRQEFIKALINFKEYSLAAPKYAPSFSGQRNSLINRVKRILQQENQALTSKENGALLVGIIIFSLMSFTIYSVKSPVLTHKHPTTALKNIYTDNQTAKKTTSKIKVLHPTNIDDASTENYHVAYQAVLKTEALKNNVTPVILPSENIALKQPTPAEISQGMDKLKNVTNFYTRIPIGEDGYTDLIQVRKADGSKLVKTLPHNKAVALIINGKLFDENEVANFTTPQIDALSDIASVIGNIALAQKLYPDLELSKYGSFVAIDNDLANKVAEISP